LLGAPAVAEPDSESVGGGEEVTINAVEKEGFQAGLEKGERGGKAEGLRESAPEFRGAVAESGTSDGGAEGARDKQEASERKKGVSLSPGVQLHSLDTMKMMMKRMETEINVRVTEAVRKQEDPLHRQRALVEEERQRYLNEEEMIVQQLK
uniref:SRC kinase signaling inhibitor 1-like n=1 Tax=Callorhinchus milii TaxID=7868 RepID=A0A4W3GK61_CALMI